MALRYCFEKDRVMNTLWLSSRNDLAVVDTDGGRGGGVTDYYKYI